MIRFNVVTVSLAIALSVAFDLSAADDFNMKWDEAEAMRQQAAELGYEWRDTRKLLKSAKKESETGNLQQAMALVAQALEQSRDAIAQSERERQNWAARVPK